MCVSYESSAPVSQFFPEQPPVPIYATELTELKTSVGVPHHFVFVWIVFLCAKWWGSN